MTGYQTRSERQQEQIKSFLASNADVSPLRLYGREVRVLQRRNPDIVIQIGSEYSKGSSLYNCFIYKKKEANM